MAIFDKQLNKASLTGRIALGISLIVIPLVVVLIIVFVKISTVNDYADKLTEEYIDIMQTADQMVTPPTRASKNTPPTTNRTARCSRSKTSSSPTTR